MTLSSDMCEGRGSWTRMPSTSSALFRESITDRSSASGVSAGMFTVVFRMPAFSQAMALLRTYTVLAGSSPTRITARCGARPCFSLSSDTFIARSPLISEARVLPSRIVAMSLVLLTRKNTLFPPFAQGRSKPPGPCAGILFSRLTVRKVPLYSSDLVQGDAYI